MSAFLLFDVDISSCVIVVTCSTVVKVMRRIVQQFYDHTRRLAVYQGITSHATVNKPGVWTVTRQVSASVDGCCVTAVNHSHVSQRYISADDNASNSSCDKLPTVERLNPAADQLKSDILLAKQRSFHMKHVLKSDIDAEITEAGAYLEESTCEIVVYVDGAFMKTKATDLYHLIRKMGTEQVCQFYHMILC